MMVRTAGLEPGLRISRHFVRTGFRPRQYRTKTAFASFVGMSSLRSQTKFYCSEVFGDFTPRIQSTHPSIGPSVSDPDSLTGGPIVLAFICDRTCGIFPCSLVALLLASGQILVDEAFGKRLH